MPAANKGEKIENKTSEYFSVYSSICSYIVTTRTKLTDKPQNIATTVWMC